MGTQPEVVGLHRTPSRRAPLEALQSAVVVADRGIDGDHHQRRGSSRQVMIAEAEVLDELGLLPGDIREQLTVRGIAPAPGDLLTIGDVQLEVVKPRTPCEVMEGVRPGLRAQLVGRAGWCARALTGGTISVGDRIEPGHIDDAPALVDLRAALVAWEPTAVDADVLAAMTAACARAVADITNATPELTPSALYRLHDVASTLVMELARSHPEAAAPILEVLAKTYRAG